MSKREQTKREVDSFQLNFLAVDPFSLKPLFGQVTLLTSNLKGPKKKKKEIFDHQKEVQSKQKGLLHGKRVKKIVRQKKL
jgi:hypothetical protein